MTGLPEGDIHRLPNRPGLTHMAQHPTTTFPFCSQDPVQGGCLRLMHDHGALSREFSQTDPPASTWTSQSMRQPLARMPLPCSGLPLPRHQPAPNRLPQKTRIRALPPRLCNDKSTTSHLLPWHLHVLLDMRGCAQDLPKLLRHARGK